MAKGPRKASGGTKKMPPKAKPVKGDKPMGKCAAKQF